MITLPRREHKLLVAIHGWSGIVLGLLLFVIIATGTVAVMGEEIGLWSSGTLETRSPLTRPVDENVKRLLALTPPGTYRQVDLRASSTNRLHVLMRGDPGPAERGVSYEVAPGGRIVHRFEGLVRDIADADPEGALSNFLINLHVRLYVPEPWGYIVTGVAGLAMLVAAISGFFIHRHLVADIFTLRRGARPVLAHRDRHGVASAWALPFVVVLAFTGCFFSFAGSVGIPALSWVSFGGDQEKLVAVLVGTHAASDPTPNSGADLDAIVADASERTGVVPNFVRIAHPGRADARINVYREPRDGELVTGTLVYDGVSGNFIEERPSIGRVPSAGGTAFELMGPLHFGNFAGLVSKAIWVGLGFMTCFVTISGMRLWLSRRDLSRLTWAAFDRATSVAAFGLPLAVGTAAVAFFLALPSNETVFWTAAGFIAGAFAAIGAAAFVARPALDDDLRLAVGVALLVLPFLRWVTGGPSWLAAAAKGQDVIIAGDVAVWLIGLAFFAAPFRAWLYARRTAIAPPVHSAAE